MYQFWFSLFLRKDLLKLSMDLTTRYFLKQFYAFSDYIHCQVTRYQINATSLRTDSIYSVYYTTVSSRVL